MIQIHLVHKPLELSQWASALTDIDTGAQGWFAGTTRRKTTDTSGKVHVTKTLHYEAHQSMAEKQLHRLSEQATEAFSLAQVIIVHRIGEVPLGEASVLVGCSSAHRKNVFEALPWILDRLKADVPIWKQETYDDDSTEWVHP